MRRYICYRTGRVQRSNTRSSRKGPVRRPPNPWQPARGGPRSPRGSRPRCPPSWGLFESEASTRAPVHAQAFALHALFARPTPPPSPLQNSLKGGRALHCTICPFSGGAMASGWFGSKAIELIKARSLFVNVSPAPTSLSERRAVLHALKRHGPIEVFKSLPVSCCRSPPQPPPAAAAADASLHRAPRPSSAPRPRPSMRRSWSSAAP